MGAAAEPSDVAQHVGSCKYHGCIGQRLDALIHIVKARHGGWSCCGKRPVSCLQRECCCIAQVVPGHEANCPA
eukprot:534018-Alexandrium_andersonii.AAC.1